MYWWYSLCYGAIRVFYHSEFKWMDLVVLFTKSATYHGLSNSYPVSSFILPLGYFLQLNQIGKPRGVGKGTRVLFLISSAEQPVASHSCLCTSSSLFRAEMLQRLWSVTQVSPTVRHLKGIQATAEETFLLRIPLPVQATPRKSSWDSGTWTRPVRGYICPPAGGPTAGYWVRLKSLLRGGQHHSSETPGLCLLVAASSTPLLRGPRSNPSCKTRAYLWLPPGQRANGRTREELSISLLLSEGLCRKRQVGRFLRKLWWKIVKFSTH